MAELLENIGVSHDCNYYDIDEFAQAIESKEDIFSVISLNIRSLENKGNEFKQFINSITNENFSPMVICLQELWGGENSNFVGLKGYHPLIYKTREGGRRGGGVGMFIRDHVTVNSIQEISIFESGILESIFVKVFTGNDRFKICGTVYRSPGSPVQVFHRHMESILETLSSNIDFKRAEEIIISGDFNIDLNKHLTHSHTAEFLSLMLSNSFLPIITIPTRFSERNATLIDQIYSNKKEVNFNAGVILTDLSDHLSCFYMNAKSGVKASQINEKSRHLTKKNIDKFSRSLSQTNWSEITRDLNPDSAFTKFEKKFHDEFVECFPLEDKKKSKSKIPKEPWMTADILKLRKQKDKLFKARIKNPSEENISRAKCLNSAYKKRIRDAKKDFYKAKFNEYSTDVKKTWGLINQVINRTKHKQSLPGLFVDEYKSYDNMQNIVNAMNEFFVNVGPNLAQKIPDSGVSFESYLGEPTNHNFIFANVSRESLKKIIQSMKPKRSCGEDGISMFLIKQIHEHILDPLVHLFNLSFKTGFIPRTFKTAKIIPIFKSGERNLFNNYRPISILPAFSKLLEKLAGVQMMDYLEKYNLLHCHQYGFRRKHNTAQPVLNLLNNIYECLNEDKFNICIFIDLKKAFDTIDPLIQLKKLEHYGFRNTAQKWFHSYLTGRQQYVFANGNKSNKANISHGIPQGSVIGPILFLIYINDLPNVTSFFTNLFADDTTFSKSSQDYENLVNECNTELGKAQKWFNSNKLSLNVSKTKFMVFRNSKNKPNFESFKIKIGEEEVERIGNDCNTKTFKFVGIVLDENLSFNDHINHISHKVSSSIYALRQAKNFLPTKTLKTVYTSLVQPHIEFGLLIWGGVKSKSMSNLIKLQKNAIRIVSKAKYNAHTTPLFGKLEILKLDDLYTFKTSEFVHKWISKKLPLSMNNILQPLQSSRSHSLKFKKPKLKALEHLPAVTFPRVWNNLPLGTKTAENFKLTIENMKEDIFCNYKSRTCTKRRCYPCRKI